MVILWVGGTLNIVTTIVPGNFDFTSTKASDENDQLSVADAPREL